MSATVGSPRAPAAVRRDPRPRPGTVVRHVTLGALVQVLALSTWYATSAVAPQLARHWSLGAGEVSWLTSCVLLGFAAGALTLGLLRVADRTRPSLLLPLGALTAAVCTALPAALPIGFVPTLALRVLTGMALAAVYPPGMKAVASWTLHRRGSAVALVVASLTLGSALPHALRTLPLPGWRSVLFLSAAAAALAAALAATTRTGPHTGHTTAPRTGAALELFRDRRQRLVTVAYLGHMWEVYGLWTWAVALLATLPGSGGPVLGVPGWGPFLLIGVAGALGCFAAGSAADRWGRVRVTKVIVTVSAVCCLLAPALPRLPATPTAVILLVWGASVIGDSPLYSALLADSSDPATVGTALTVQMALGYSLAAIPVLFLPHLAAHIGWPWALLALTPGPLASALSLRRLRGLDAVVAPATPRSSRP
ncbi:MFS transporter [Streptomyces sp. J2-1]|uniref:MFS transporter n=1 Tax=Streptomyces corallincola TaxID=2851888 RepID=UPI001C394C40|nr:MFS transporter [Streptomyces corallincola]MBV2355811.1 MFS transporter [Streptomyces corallincola]